MTLGFLHTKQTLSQLRPAEPETSQFICILEPPPPGSRHAESRTPRHVLASARLLSVHVLCSCPCHPHHKSQRSSSSKHLPKFPPVHPNQGLHHINPPVLRPSRVSEVSRAVSDHTAPSWGQGKGYFQSGLHSPKGLL